MTRVETSDGDHGPHRGEPADSAAGASRSTRRPRIPWRIVYLASLVIVAASLFLLVPGSGSVALLVFLGGLMALHHLPGGHGHRH